MPTKFLVEANFSSTGYGTGRLTEIDWKGASGPTELTVHVVTARVVPDGRAQFRILTAKDGSWLLDRFSPLAKPDSEKKDGIPQDKALSLARAHLAERVGADAFLEDSWKIQDRGSAWVLTVQRSKPSRPAHYEVRVDKDSGRVELQPLR
jgi:hypothetical protein